MNVHNTYFGLRHGRSEANEKGIIIGHPDNGIPYYGLTELGKKQVKQSILRAKQKGILHERIIMFSSPFKRTKETAEIAQEILGIKEIRYRSELQERSFGNLEQTMYDYTNIWFEDAKNPYHTLHDVESIAALQKRMLTLIDGLEKTYKNKIILLVSHGDPLHVLQAGLTGVKLTEYRTISMPENAEIRKLHQ